MAGRWPASDLQQLESERFELVDHAVERGLVGERSAQHGDLSASASGQRRKRLEHRRADRAAHPDLVVARRPSLAAARRSRARHAIRIDPSWVSAPHLVLMNPPPRVDRRGGNMWGCGAIGTCGWVRRRSCQEPVDRAEWPVRTAGRSGPGDSGVGFAGRREDVTGA